jgi:hypothetical protein
LDGLKTFFTLQRRINKMKTGFIYELVVGIILLTSIFLSGEKGFAAFLMAHGASGLHGKTHKLAGLSPFQFIERAVVIIPFGPL